VALSPKQNAFVAAYLVSLNASQAAVEAGYSPRTAEKIGSENLRKPEVKRAIDEALKRRAERVEVKADDVLRELVRIFSADISKAYDINGKLMKLHEIPEDVRRCIVGVKSKELFEGFGEDREYVGDLVEVKFADKVRGIELAMKHLGLLVEKHEHSGHVTLEQLLLASAEGPK
jgi:phage terminase small subunit